MKLKIFFHLFLSLSLAGCMNNSKAQHADKLQYPAGYPDTANAVIEQLRTYPLPRYAEGNKLLRLFNWMDPYYMAGQGIPKVSRKELPARNVAIQRELMSNWNYGIVIPNSAFNKNGEIIKLANEHPEADLHIITFWMGVRPKLIGYDKYPKAFIINPKLDSSLYITHDFYGRKKREIKFNFPDSMARIDGLSQKFFLEQIIKDLTRPITLINENGEEPPGPYLLDAIKSDKEMIRMRDSMKISSWYDFMSIRKLQMRNAYSNAFMQGIPELKSTKFSFYTVEAGPVDRFDWNIMKKSLSSINGIYYSTPDFYPRWPKNWKDWDGPWHGWSWIASGRKKEIKAGDYLFSPFVSAGWSNVQEEDVRPGQWLGLLKCLSVIGAEFYYVGYFSISKPFPDPAKWAWQAAMPAYAQAITSRYEDVLRDGNVLFDEDQEPIISYDANDKHVLVTIRKHNKKDRYIICGTYQPFSNETSEIPDKKNVTVKFGEEKLSFEVRRQGSVYVYEKTADKKLFYQLDTWHENAHPDHWSHQFLFEAEVGDSLISNNMIYTENNAQDDYTKFTSYVSLSGKEKCRYLFTCRDSVAPVKYVFVKYRGEGTLNVDIKPGSQMSSLKQKLSSAAGWKWEKIALKEYNSCGTEQELLLSVSKGKLDLDKVYLSSEDKHPD